MRHIAMIVVLACLAFVACGDDDADPVKIEGPYTRAFVDRSEMWHVINNIELAYNQRKISYYEALLDENFTFFLSTGDVGGSVPESWARDVEVQANTNLFSSNPPGDLLRVKSIKLDILWETDPNSQTPHPDGDLLIWATMPDMGPNLETWYTTTVFYDFQITIDLPNYEEDLHYYSSSGSKAQFIVRNAGTVDAPRWALVEMRDLGAMGAFTSASAATEQSTWGGVKALYR
ncbi:MAG TPA: hypothetical protein VF128_14195 [Gemmatimonadaceae bacterium]